MQEETVGAEAVFRLDVRARSASGLDVSVGSRALDLCESFAGRPDWAGQNIEKDWSISRGAAVAESGRVTVGLKVMGIGPPPRDEERSPVGMAAQPEERDEAEQAEEVRGRLSFSTPQCSHSRQLGSGHRPSHQPLPMPVLSALI